MNEVCLQHNIIHCPLIRRKTIERMVHYATGLWDLNMTSTHWLVLMRQIFQKAPIEGVCCCCHDNRGTRSHKKEQHRCLLWLWFGQWWPSMVWCHIFVNKGGQSKMEWEVCCLDLLEYLQSNSHNAALFQSSSAEILKLFSHLIKTVYFLFTLLKAGRG